MVCLALRDMYIRGKCNVKKLPETLELFVVQRKQRYSDRKADGESSICWPNKSTSPLEWPFVVI